MKKIIALGLIVALFLSCCACGLPLIPDVSKHEPHEVIDTLPALTPQSEESTVEESSQEVTLPSPDEIIYETYFNDGEYYVDFGDGYGNTYAFSYHLPQLDLTTQGANAINNAINERFVPRIEDSYSMMNQNLSIYTLSVGWSAICYGDLITLRVNLVNEADSTDYGIYCYQPETGCWLQGEELLEHLQIDKDDFLEECRAAALAYYDEWFGEYIERFGEDDFYRSQREWTGSDENINMENLQFYPEADGTLTVIAPIGSIAGASWYYRELSLDLRAG